jgi:putative oxidoreductase
MNNETQVSQDRAAVDLSLLVLRIVVGVIFVAHGGQKLFGLWGGDGLEASVAKLGGGTVAYLVVIGEFFGGLGLIVGFLARFSSASLIVIMIGAIVKVHGANGFFASGGGYEYNLALIGLLVPIFLCGPGRFSIGRLFMPKSQRTGRPLILVE